MRITQQNSYSSTYVSEIVSHHCIQTNVNIYIDGDGNVRRVTIGLVMYEALKQTNAYC